MCVVVCVCVCEGKLFVCYQQGLDQACEDLIDEKIISNLNKILFSLKSNTRVLTFSEDPVSCTVKTNSS